MSQNKDQSCPMAKRARLNIGTSVNEKTSNEDILKENLKKFHVLDEINVDENMSDNEGNSVDFRSWFL